MKVCFVAPGVYPLLSDSCTAQWIGGAELQQLQIGRGLSRAGIEVCYLVADHGQPDLELVDGVTLHKSYREGKGLPGIRFFYPRLVTTWRALRRADADLYYCRGASFYPALLALFCRFYGRRSVFAGAHDTDFHPGSLLLPNLRDKLLYRLGVRHVDGIIVQSRRQQKLLKENFGLEGEVIRNFLLEGAEGAPADGGTILWVATIRGWKRPLQFVRLARAFPEERFVMIGGRDEAEDHLFRQVVQECALLPNIDFLGFCPLEETERHFARCKLFVNTSCHEGFPNTFLQAWRRGVPVVSYVDPDGVISENSLGSVVRSEEGLRDAVRGVLQGRRPDANAVRSYFLAHHSSGVIEQYRTFFERVANAS